LPIKGREICLSSLKVTTNGCKCLNVLNRFRLEKFQKTAQNISWFVNGHEVRMWRWVHFKHPWQARIKWQPSGYTLWEISLVLNIDKVTVIFSVFFVNCANATTRNSLSF